MDKVTLFQRKVYNTITQIPIGKVATYKQVAKAIGCKSCQAVGQALKKNPFAPEVPCHRVISSDLTIGGFYGQVAGVQIEKKFKLLIDEGIEFENGKLKRLDCLFDFNTVIV